MSEPWEDFKTSGASAKVAEGPWTEFKDSGPWNEFKRPVQPLNPTQAAEPSLGAQIKQGFTRGLQAVQPIAQIPSLMGEKLGDVVLGIRNIPHYLGLDPTLTTRENFMPAAGVQGVLKDIEGKVPTGPGDIELATAEALLPKYKDLAEKVLGNRGLSPTMSHAIARGAHEMVTPENVALAATLAPAELPAAALKGMGVGFGAPALKTAVEQLQQGDKEGAAINATLASLMLGGAMLPERAAPVTGALPTEYPQGHPDFPFVMKDRQFNMPPPPSPPRLLPEVAQAARAVYNLPDVQKFQEQPPLIGRRPMTIEQQVLLPTPEGLPTKLAQVSDVASVPKQGLAAQVPLPPETKPFESIYPTSKETYTPTTTKVEPMRKVEPDVLPPSQSLYSGVPLPGDFERYQELTEDALRAIRTGQMPSQDALGEIERLKKDYGGFPPPKADAKSLRPAIRLEDGKIAVGEQGETHADILKRIGRDPREITHFDPRRGFVSADRPDVFLDRQKAQQLSGLPGTAKAGGLDSMDLPGAMKGAPQNAIPKLRTDSVSETQPSGNIPPMEEKVRSGADAKGEAQGGQTQEAQGLEPRMKLGSGVQIDDVLDFIKKFNPLQVKFGPTNERFIQGLAKRYPSPVLSQEGFNQGLDTRPIQEITKQYGKDWRKGLGDYLKEVERLKKSSGGELYSGVPYPFERPSDRRPREPQVYWIHPQTGGLIPESREYMTAKDVLGHEPGGQLTDEMAKNIEKEMAQKGFTKVIEQGGTIFVDKNASTAQLMGVRNIAKEGDKELKAGVSLYSGIPIFDPKTWEDAANKIRFSTAPKHVGVDEHVANRMIEYAAADVTHAIGLTGPGYKENVKKAWIDAGVNAGLYVRSKTAPMIGGRPGVRIPELGNVYVRSDLVPEVDQVVKRRGEMEQGVHRMLLDLATDLQLIGPTDFLFHTANMFSSIVKSPGKSGNYVLDQLFRQPGVKHLDAFVRVGKNLMDAISNDPAIKQELTKISALGALRPVESGRGLVAKLTGGVIDTGKWIGLIDRAGRLARNKMFDNLVEQKLVKDNPVDRREFINQMGQYNNKLMSRHQEMLKGVLSQFVVAGRTFNKNAVQSATLMNEVRAANPAAYAKMKLSNLIAATSTWLVVPVVANSIITGKPFGRAGTPIGKIDTGKDDPNGRHIVYDPAKLDLSRRGMRITGLEATIEGIRQGDKPKDISARAVRDIVNGQLHPWEGPPVRVVEAYGKELARSGKPDEALGEAIKAVNPTVTAYFGKSEPRIFGDSDSEQPDKGGLPAVGTQLVGAFGLSPGRRLRHTEVVAETGKQPIESMTLAERLSAESEYKKRAEKLSPEQKAVGAGRAIIETTRRGQDLKKTLSKPDANWLDSRDIPVQGFGNYLTIDGQKLYLTPKETDRLAEFMKEEYTKAIAEARTQYDDIGDEERPSFLRDTFGFARDEARQRMLEELEKSSSAIELNRKKYKMLK